MTGVRIDLDDLELERRGDPHGVVTEGGAAGMLGLRIDLVQDAARVPIQLVRLEIDLIDTPESVVGSLQAVRLWSGALEPPDYARGVICHAGFSLGIVTI